MRYFKFLLFVTIFFSLSTACSQKNECDRLLEKKIDIDLYASDPDKSLSIFKEDFKQLILCKYDSIDLQIYFGPENNNPIIGSVLLELYQSEAPTYYDLFIILQEFRERPEYAMMRNIVLTYNKLLPKIALPGHWEEDVKMLELININNEFHTEDIKLLVNEYSEDSISYQKLLTIYFENLKNEQKNVYEDHSISQDFIKLCDTGKLGETIPGLLSYYSYEDALKCSKKTGKNILIFFNAYGSVNAREMEDHVLSDKHIKKLISENFIFANLFVDDKTPLDEKDVFISEYSGKRIKTTGRKNIDLQITKFSSNAQPSFYILSPKDIKIGSVFYELNINSFIDFLKKGINE